MHRLACLIIHVVVCRAVAQEALGSKREALADYRQVVSIAPTAVPDALTAIKRLERDLGIASDSRQAMGKVTEEDAKQLDETKQRVKDVALQKARAADQQQSSLREKRQVELTLAQIAKLPEEVG